nr:unnamed protein product [Digitaria exilis]
MGYAQLVIGPAGSGKVRVPDSPARFLFALGSLRGGLGRAMIGLVDGAGQIELFTHVPVLRNFVEHLKRKNFNICAVYLLDSQFVSDVTKYISGCMASLSAMIQLELPHINILSKMDLVSNKKDVEEYLDPNAQVLLSQLNRQMAPRFGKLNKCLAELVDDYSMVNFIPLDLRKESSIQYVLSSIDSCIQYGEDADVKIRDFDLPEDDD